MATTAVNTGNLTLLDQVKRRAPDGSIARVVEMLTQRNVLYTDAVWKEGNLPTGHRIVQRYGLPSVAFRRFNEGVAPSKSRTQQFDEACGMMEAWSAIDVELAKLNGDEAAFRLSEANAFVQSMQNQVETALFYASTQTNPEQILGFTPRMNAKAANSINPGQVILATATAAGSDQSSIWLVGWGDQSVYCIFPKGSSGGLEHNDRGIIPWDDGSGTGRKFDAYVSNWKWKFGLAVEDWRYLVRIANVDSSVETSASTAIVEAMVRAYHQIREPNSVRLAFYTNRTVATMLHLQALKATANSTLTIENIGGKPITSVLGIPVRETDALLATEAAIS